MVKNKKMSKTSIAVIVLALLLVFSLVMGMTGAWFTDTKSDTSNSESLTFGKIQLDGVSATFGESQNTATVLPGDVLNFSASVQLLAASEAAYVKVTPSTTAVSLYVDSAAQNPAFDYAFATWGSPSNWTVVKTYEDGSKLFLVAKGAAAMTVGGTITVDRDLANIAYSAANAQVRVNSVGGAYSVNFGISAVAVQARTLCDKAADWTNDDITAIETALGNAVAAVQGQGE